MKVHFTDVGRNKRSWVAECQELSYEWLLKQVKAHGVMSRNIDFDEDGRIWAGLRGIGWFEIEEDNNV